MTSDPVPSADLLRQIDSLCDRFESAWSAERRPLIESYLPQVHEDARPALLTGRLVYEPRVPPREAFRRILLEEPQLEWADRAEVPDALQRAVRQALAPRPEDRFADVEALRLELLPLTLG
jgi:hypothetical protein